MIKTNYVGDGKLHILRVKIVSHDQIYSMHFKLLEEIKNHIFSACLSILYTTWTSSCG